MNTQRLKKNQKVYVLDNNHNITTAILKDLHNDTGLVSLCTKQNQYKTYPKEQIFQTPTEAHRYQKKGKL